jgi:ubiquinol-cytochrome c reductase cytochrome c subunit
MILRRWWRRTPLLPRPARVALATCLAAGGLVLAASSSESPAQSGSSATGAGGSTDRALVQEGGRLYDESCSSCHGTDLRGMPGRAPSLRGAGALAADFYLRTGRMPLAEPRDEPVRTESPFSDREIRALVAFVGSFGGPPIPAVNLSRGDLAEGRALFTDSCAGCHQILAQGGIPTDGVAPDLKRASPVDVAEAIEIGPYVMPRFRGRFSKDEVASLARYVDYAKHPDDRGGWGIGHIGPVPEGMVAWFLAGGALLLTVRLIGERMET